ncbi:putative integrase [Enterobacter cloacae]|uniref:Putative integrase n=1 Tax=Enterobacter cloacae TaxID=550 RepID=A0A377M7H8_ENTCL|nr:putative integrase [Enterobacter cloacae]
MADIVTFEKILDDYFFNKVLRRATEWSYRKVVRTFLEFYGERYSSGKCDANGCSEMETVCSE